MGSSAKSRGHPELMELAIMLVGKTSKQSVTGFIAKMLSEDAPLFVDDVDAEYHTAFEALSYFEQPDYITVSGKELLAQWELGGDAEYEEILLSLNEAGLDKIFAYINLDQAEKIVKCENDSLFELPFDSLKQLNKAENSQERQFEFLLSLLRD